MDKKKKQKSEKYWLDIIILLAGLLGSLFLVYFSSKKITDTAEQYPVPKEIINIKEEIQPLLETLQNPDKSDELTIEKYTSIIEIDQILENNALEFSRSRLFPILHCLKLKQALNSSKDPSQLKLKKLVYDLQISLYKSLIISLWYQSLQADFEENIAQQVSQHLENITYQTLSDNSRIILNKNSENLDINVFKKINNIKLKQSKVAELQGYQEHLNTSYKIHHTLIKLYFKLLVRHVFSKTYEYNEYQIDRISSQDFINDFEQYLMEIIDDFDVISIIQELKSYVNKELLEEFVSVTYWHKLLEENHKIVISEEKINQILTVTTNDLTQTLNIELRNSYELREDRNSITALQKEIKLALLFFLVWTSILVAFRIIAEITKSFILIISCDEKKVFLIPEECVAELEIVYQELKHTNKNLWTIYLIMLWNILVLLKSIYIQVAIENLLLPGKNKRD